MKTEIDFSTYSSPDGVGREHWTQEQLDDFVWQRQEDLAEEAEARLGLQAEQILIDCLAFHGGDYEIREGIESPKRPRLTPRCESCRGPVEVGLAKTTPCPCGATLEAPPYVDLRVVSEATTSDEAPGVSAAKGPGNPAFSVPTDTGESEATSSPATTSPPKLVPDPPSPSVIASTDCSLPKQLSVPMNPTPGDTKDLDVCQAIGDLVRDYLVRTPAKSIEVTTEGVSQRPAVDLIIRDDDSDGIATLATAKMLEATACPNSPMQRMLSPACWTAEALRPGKRVFRTRRDPQRKRICPNPREGSIFAATFKMSRDELVLLKIALRSLKPPPGASLRVNHFEVCDAKEDPSDE